MPYIKQNRRDQLDENLQELITLISQLEKKDVRDLDGDLNYVVSKLLLGVFDLKSNPKYSKFNSAIGVLECVKQELYRRAIAPYEDQKIVENGEL